MNAEQVVSLKADSISESGRVEFSWEKPKSLEVILQQSKDALFANPVVRYQGTEVASVITGLPEGTHYFRLGTAESDQWSETQEIEVAYVSHTQLFLLLGLGAFVVLATVGAIIGGHWASKSKTEPGEGGAP